MFKITATLAAILTLSACASQPEPFDWRTYVLPLENNEYITDAQSHDKNHARETALKAAYGACDDTRPVFIDRSLTRTGLMSETTSAVYNLARNAATLLGEWTPGIDNTEYTAAYKFKCYKEKSL